MAAMTTITGFLPDKAGSLCGPVCQTLSRPRTRKKCFSPPTRERKIRFISTASIEVNPAWTGATGAVRDRPSPWVRGPAWDSFWMLSALWLAPIAFWLSRGYSNPEESPLDLLYFGLTALFWIGHRFCSTYLAYFTEAYRPLLRTQPVRFVLLPLLITLGCFAVFLPSDEAMRWNREQRLVVLAVIDYVFVTYHFAAQHFGALSIYRARAAGRPSAQRRSMDKWYALGIGGGLVFIADLLAGAVAYQDQWSGGLVPSWLISAQDNIRLGSLFIVIITTGGMLWVEMRAPVWSWPRILYVAGLALMVVIALRPRSLFLFLVIWTSQHWILATGLASRTPIAEPTPVRGRGRQILHALNTRPWAILFLLVILSVILLPFFEVEGNRMTDATYYGDRIFGAFAVGLRESTWVPALIAIGFATGFTHYLLDRAIFRFSNPQVRSAARGLLTPAQR